MCSDVTIMSDWMSFCWIGQRAGSKISKEIRWDSHQLSGVNAVYLEGLDGLLETLTTWVSAKVHLAFRWWVIARSCLILSLDATVVQTPCGEREGCWLHRHDSHRPRLSQTGHLTGRVAVRCVTTAWVGGLGHAERSALIGWTVIAQFTLFELHWTTLCWVFFPKSERERGKHSSKDTALWMLHSVTTWS